MQRVGSGWSLSVSPALSAVLLLTFSVPPAGAFHRFGVQLLPVGLAVLVDETDLGLGWGRGWGRGRVLLLLLRGPVGGGEGLHDLPVQDAQGHTSHRVLEPVLRGNAVVHAPVSLRHRLQQDPMSCLQHLPVPTQLGASKRWKGKGRERERDIDRNGRKKEKGKDERGEWRDKVTLFML